MKNISNCVQLVGNLGQDVEITTFDSGNKKASFTLATHDYYKNNKGEKVEDTQWHNIIAWGKLAENIAAITSKGNQVLLKGKLTNRSYEAKDGNKKYITEIVASEFMKLDKKEVPF